MNMISISRRRRAARTPLLVATVLAALVVDQGRPAAQQQEALRDDVFTLTTDVNIVSVDVVVRDRDGNIVRGLTRDDFTIIEDGKPQTLETFSFQEIATEAAPIADEVALLENLEDKLRAEVQRAASATAQPEISVSQSVNPLQNRRMLVLLFDVSSMQPEDIQRAIEQAREYVEADMAPADLVAVVTIGSRLNVLTDFTSSREDLQAALRSLAYSEGTEVDLAALTTVATETQTETSTENAGTTEANAFEDFNNDVRLRFLKTLCETLTPIQQKKAVLYFSGGMRMGEDNRIEQRAATNTCNRGNTSLYTVDSRGLQAIVAGGGASSRGGSGTSLFTGQNAFRGFSRQSQSTEGLNTLAADTGGRMFTDTNDFGEAFARVQRDLAAYYLLGYSSTNPARDGKFRQIQVRINRPDLRGLEVEARPGYYAGRSFENTNNRDRELQLEDQLAAAISSTDVPMVLGTGWFRQNDGRFYVPIALAIPGSSIPVAIGAREVSLDVRGLVYDEQGRTVGRIKETLKVPSGGAETLAGRQIIYQSGVTLPSGVFSVKAVVRENTGGAIGSFEAPIYIPQLAGEEIKVSTVVMSTQVQETRDRSSDNPLIRDGVQLLPNLTRVVGRNQKIYFYYEVYDPGLAELAPHLRTSLSFYRGNIKVFETPMVERAAIDDKERGAVLFQFEVPADQFKPGEYTCQINVIDTVASKVAFPRLSFVVLE